jgi:N-acetyl-anhydromuramyl-L-alanine amidase AmpD
MFGAASQRVQMSRGAGYPMIHEFLPDSRIGVRPYPSPNHNERKGKPIDSIVLHYTGMESADAALDLLCDAAHEVSSHYLVAADGQAFQLVPEARRAWHAGRGTWAGETDMNARSIGIEMANAGHKYGAPPFEDAQIETVIALCKDIAGRHVIAPNRILGHSDIAVGRKIDPGEIFPWDRLARRFRSRSGGAAGIARKLRLRHRCDGHIRRRNGNRRHRISAPFPASARARHSRPVDARHACASGSQRACNLSLASAEPRM